MLKQEFQSHLSPSKNQNLTLLCTISTHLIVFICWSRIYLLCNLIMLSLSVVMLSVVYAVSQLSPLCRESTSLFWMSLCLLLFWGFVVRVNFMLYAIMPIIFMLDILMLSAIIIMLDAVILSIACWMSLSWVPLWWFSLWLFSIR